jgi:hypothetical protein
MARAILLWGAYLVCGLALAGQVYYLWGYLAQPENEYRDEYLEGVFMVGTLSSCVWLPLLIVTFVHKATLPRMQCSLRFSVSLAVLGLSLLSVVLGFIT